MQKVQGLGDTASLAPVVASMRGRWALLPVLQQLQRAPDLLKVPGGLGRATLACVAEIDRAPDAELIALPGEPTLTPGHPVRDAATGAWRAARDVPGGARVPVGAAVPRVYNFVLVGGVTVVLTTRQPRTEIFALLDCVVLMRDGQRGRARRAPQATD